jgi:3-hydroxybutyryl-CoA dehydratase
MTQATSPEPGGRWVQVGEHMVGQITLTHAEIATFAPLCEDLNPLHHDESYAQHTQFGGVIAYGPQITSLVMGLVATSFSKSRAVLGLEFAFRFLKAVRAGEMIDMEWEVVTTEPKVSLKGEMVTWWERQPINKVPE